MYFKKGLSRIFSYFFYALSIASFLVGIVTHLVPANVVQAGSGAIWTTATTCLNPAPQDQNEYAVGESVHIRGEKFDPNAAYTWTITGQPGSSDPNLVIKSGAGTTDVNGYLCTYAYTILPGDDGVYTVDLMAFGENNAKNDNYHVSGFVPAPLLVLDKSASPLTYTSAGNVISYLYLLANNGNVELTAISISDDKATVSCPATTLLPAASMTCSASYIITSGDVLAQSVTNTAQAASLFGTQAVVSNIDTATVTLSAIPGMSFNKSASPLTYNAVGNTINYSYLITNTGNVPLTGIFVSDDKASVTCPGTTIPVNGSMTCSAFHSITQAEINAGSLTNTANVVSIQAPTLYDSETVNGQQSTGISLVKAAFPITYASVGTVISYTYVVYNSGNIPLTGVVVEDDLANVTCLETEIAPFGSMTCNASYIIQQADLNNGFVTNHASADSNQAGPVTDSATVTAVQDFELSFNKVASPSTYTQSGDVIGYSYIVSNTGNITITNITVSDDKASVSCPFTELAPGASMTCIASYLISQLDVDAGSVTNTATLTALEVGPYSDQETVTANQAPALTIVKTASPTSYSYAGQSIAYSYLITNIGNLTLTNVSLVDDKALPICPTTVLAPAESMTCTTNYMISLPDMDFGSVTNTATVDSNQTPSASDSEIITAIKLPGMTLGKLASPLTYDAVSQTITYAYLVANTGNVTLTGIVVTDNKAIVSCPAVSLAPQADMTCSASYSILQGDLDIGHVTNEAQANSNQVGPVYATETVNATQRASILFDKVASPENYDSPDDIIGYTYTITNNGNVTLTGITVTDDKAVVTCPATTLLPGSQLVCTSSYNIIQPDIDFGSVTNTAIADSSQTAPSQDSEIVYAIQEAVVQLDKVPDPSTYDEVGDVISYSYYVTNSGNITLTDITVTDDKATVTCPSTSIAPLGTMECNASYVITQEDLENGSVVNVATARSGALDPAIDTETVLAIQTPLLQITKTADPVTYDEIGDLISYSYLVTNMGNVILHGILVTDDKASVNCPNSILEPAESMTCTASYTISQVDIDDSYVTNIGTADSDETDPVIDTQTINAELYPSIVIEKSAAEPVFIQLGDAINYTYIVTNTGNVTLGGVGVDDDKATVWCPKTELIPDETMTCYATYIVEQVDLDAWLVTNIAFSYGYTSREALVQSEPVTVSVPRYEMLSLISFCANDPSLYDGWRVINPNPYTVVFEFMIPESAIAGVGEVLANAAINIFTPAGAGNGMLVLYSGGILQDSARAATGCENPNPPGPPPFNPPPVLLIPVTAQPTILIPVTGFGGEVKALTEKSYFGFSLGFAGIGLIIGSRSKKQK